MNVTRDKDISSTSIPIQTTNALAKELQTEGENKLIKQQKALENQVVHYSNLGINKSIESIAPSLQQNNSEIPDQLPLFVTLKTLTTSEITKEPSVFTYGLSFFRLITKPRMFISPLSKSS